MTSLEELLKQPKNRGRGCIVCGLPNCAAITVIVRALGEKGKLTGPSKSKQINFCEAHAVEKWLSLTEALTRNGDSA